MQLCRVLIFLRADIKLKMNFFRLLAPFAVLPGKVLPYIENNKQRVDIDTNTPHTQPAFAACMAERSKAFDSSSNLKGRGFEPHCMQALFFPSTYFLKTIQHGPIVRKV